MLNVITGKQRAGKTFYCVTLIIEYLKTSTRRELYVNLPVNPDKIAFYISPRNPARYQSILRRIHIFHSFRNFGEARTFYKRNPDWCKVKNLIPEKFITDFWNHTRPNSVIFLDEVYQWFGSGNYKNADLQEQRKQLLTYTRQHGHYKDDMYLISHSKDDLDVHIKRGIQYLYEIRNSKYTNVFEWRWMRGFKWPVQFFIIDGYEFGETRPSDSWRLLPEKEIFKCYESFSGAEVIKGKERAGEDSESSDTGLNFWWNFKRFILQSWMGIGVLGGLIVGGVVFWRMIEKMTNVSSSDFAKKQEEKKKEDLKEEEVTEDGEKKEEKKKEEVKKPVIVAVNPSQVVWDDGFVLRKGTEYYGFKVQKITRDFVSFVDSKGDSYGVRLSGIREVSGSISK